MNTPSTQAHLYRRSVLALLAGSLASAVTAQESSEVFSGFGGTEVRFASVDIGRSLLTARDEWMMVTSDFMQRAIMGSAQPVTAEAFTRWNGDAVRPWTDQQ